MKNELFLSKTQKNVDFEKLYAINYELNSRRVLKQTPDSLIFHLFNITFI